MSHSLHCFYNEILNKYGLDVKAVYLIEASLFISMAALHYEDIDRQTALFLTGIIILNNFFEGEYENLY